MVRRDNESVAGSRLETFESSRRALIGLAYRMLGSIGEAEDVVQDAWLKLARRREFEPGRGYLLRTVSTLCIDRLRRLKRERRDYPGPWLPEPIVEIDGRRTVESEPDVDTGLLQLGLLRLLERLTGAERIVFVLREGFELDHGEISLALGISVAAARQRHARARRKLGIDAKAGVGHAAAPDPELLAAFERALLDGDVARVVELLDGDAVLLTDGGGVVSAARAPVTGAERIARVLVHVCALGLARGLSPHAAVINGAPGWVFASPEGPDTCVTLTGRAGRVVEILIVRNPGKLARLPRR